MRSLHAPTHERTDSAGHEVDVSSSVSMDDCELFNETS